MRTKFFLALLAAGLLLNQSSSATTLEETYRAIGELRAVRIANYAGYQQDYSPPYIPQPINFPPGENGEAAMPPGTPLANWGEYPKDGFYDYLFNPYNETGIVSIVQHQSALLNGIKTFFIDASEDSHGRLIPVEGSAIPNLPPAFNDSTMPRLEPINGTNYLEKFDALQKNLCKLKYLGPSLAWRFAGPSGPRSPVQTKVVTGDVYDQLGNMNWCDWAQGITDSFLNAGWQNGPSVDHVGIGDRPSFDFDATQLFYYHCSFGRCDLSVEQKLTRGCYYLYMPGYSGKAFFYVGFLKNSNNSRTSWIIPPGSNGRYHLFDVAEGSGIIKSKLLDDASVRPGNYQCDGDTSISGHSEELAAYFNVYFKPRLKQALKECGGCLSCKCESGDLDCQNNSV